MAVWYVTVSGKVVQEFKTRREAQAFVDKLRYQGYARHTIKIERD